MTIEGTFIRFPSHRAREYGLRECKDKPVAHYELGRGSGYGIYLVSADDLNRLRGRMLVKSSHVGFTLVRDTTNLLKCW